MSINANGRYNCVADYVTEMDYPEICYKAAAQSIRATVGIAEDNKARSFGEAAKLSPLKLSINYNGKWCVRVKVVDADEPLPMALGFDELETPEAIYEYYIDYVLDYFNRSDSSQPPIVRDDIEAIFEGDSKLKVRLVDFTPDLSIPYPRTPL